MVRLLPIWVGLMPVLGVTVAYVLNVDATILPSCMPLLEGCTSISSTGRQLPGSLMFKAIMLPQAALLAALCWIAASWLRSIRPQSRLPRAVLICGVIGSVALVIYVTLLGTQAPFYEFMRRFGIYFYFLGTALSQLLLTLGMRRSALRTAMLTIITMPLVLGVANLIQKELTVNADQIENAIEWSAALLMQAWFVLLFFAWHATGIKIEVTAKAD